MVAIDAVDGFSAGKTKGGITAVPMFARSLIGAKQILF
jgi:hypothetical protein